jgi:transposase
VDVKRAREGGGVEALKRRPAPGARPRLSEQQRARVPELLAQGAEAHGFRGELWTCERVAIVIRKGSFWGQLPSGSCERLLKALRQSLHKPKRRAFQRNEEAIETTGKRRSGLL